MALVARAYGITPQEAEPLLGSAGKGFVAKPKNPPPAAPPPTNDDQEDSNG